MHPDPDGLLRPDDGDAYRQALRLLRDRSGLPVVFGGRVLDRELTLDQFVGVRTSGLRGLRVTPGSGLGGRVLAAGRPVTLNDYGSAVSITHDYDAPVLAEGIRAVTAVPVTVLGVVRGVLYAADRSPAPLGGRAVALLADAARRLAAELSVRDEVDRRLRLARTLPAEPGGSLAPRVAEELRALHAELGGIAQDVGDPALRARLRSAARRLTTLDSPQDPPPPSPLSPRELDVLSQVALGCTNAEAAARLSLLPETVKAYLRGAMRKLDARTRHEAVVSARRRGLLP